MEHEKGIGLVLAGGGTKGAYEIGAWKALIEAGIIEQITGFSGSSIGAFNTALMLNGDFDAARALWESLQLTDFADLNVDLVQQKFADAKGHTPKEALAQNIRLQYTAEQAVDRALSMVLDRVDRKLNPVGDETASDQRLAYNRHTKRDFVVWCFNNLLGSGFANPERLRESLEQLLPEEFFSPLGMDVFSTVCLWDTEKNVSGQAEYISWEGKTKEEILDLIIASASLPVLYPQNHKDGRIYVDGGYADNEPIEPLYQAGYRKFFIIYLDKYKGKKLTTIIKEQEKTYPDAVFMRLLPNKKFNDGFAKSCVISKKLTADRMQMGYEDCKRFIDELKSNR